MRKLSLEQEKLREEVIKRIQLEEGYNFLWI